jgi:hypothetical protein
LVVRANRDPEQQCENRAFVTGGRAFGPARSSPLAVIALVIVIVIDQPEVSR